MFHQQLILLTEISQKNGYQNNFIYRHFKLFLNNIHILKEKFPTVEKKPLRLVLPYLGYISLQTRTKLQTSIKGVINCCKLQVIFKSQNKLCNIFRFKDLFPKYSHQVWFISFSVDYAMNPITENAFDILL